MRIFILLFQKTNQISSTDFSLKFKKYVTMTNVIKDKPLLKKDIKISTFKKHSLVTSYLYKVKAILKLNKINLGKSFDLEISHHYGLEKFEKFGCFLFNCINREYAKKIIVMLSNQKHPLHRHKRKRGNISGFEWNTLLHIKWQKEYFERGR